MKQKEKFKYYLNILEECLVVLPDKSEEDPLNTLIVLWERAANKYIHIAQIDEVQLSELTHDHFQILDDLVKKRLNGVPLAHLSERQVFLGIGFIIKKGLYIPRKDTELLAHTAKLYIRSSYISKQQVNVIDMCTGIGTVALAIANDIDNTMVYGSDIFEPAIDMAKTNAEYLNLKSRSSFFAGDMFEPFEDKELRNKVQIVVSAPPFITGKKVDQMPNEISDHEPREAFDAGPFGLDIFLKLITGASLYLESKGYLIFECGIGQGDFLIKRIRSNKNYRNVIGQKDVNDSIRVIMAQKV